LLVPVVEEIFGMEYKTLEGNFVKNKVPDKHNGYRKNGEGARRVEVPLGT